MFCVAQIFNVAVDLRRSSATFGRSVGVTLRAEAREQLWIPVGFAHGFYVLSDWAEVNYKVTDLYYPQGERTLIWNEPSLQIAWPIVEGRQPILSPKDEMGLPLRDAEVFA